MSAAAIVSANASRPAAGRLARADVDGEADRQERDDQAGQSPASRRTERLELAKSSTARTALGAPTNSSRADGSGSNIV